MLPENPVELELKSVILRNYFKKDYTCNLKYKRQFLPTFHLKYQSESTCFWKLSIKYSGICSPLGWVTVSVTC